MVLPPFMVASASVRPLRRLQRTDEKQPQFVHSDSAPQGSRQVRNAKNAVVPRQLCGDSLMRRYWRGGSLGRRVFSPLLGRDSPTRNEEGIMKRLRPTTIIACLALFLSLGGGAWAAQHYVITSKSQIKPSVLGQLKGNRGPKGAKGDQGIQGNQGSQGIQGSPGANGTGSIVVAGEVFDVGPLVEGASVEESVSCPAGSSPTGGGGWVQGKLVLVGDSPGEMGHGWQIEAVATEAFGADEGEVSVTVFCKTE